MAFTEEQKEVLVHSEGHAKVSAVAGSGKTSTMVGHVVYLLHKGVDPEDILILMFNNKAQKEFHSRLKVQCDSFNKDVPKVRTFHSFGNSLTSELEQQKLLPKSRLSTKPWELDNMAKQVLKSTTERKRHSLAINRETTEDFVDFIDIVKSDIISPKQKFEELKLKEDLSIYIDAFHAFETRRRKAHIRFFSDLIFDPIMRMTKDPSIKKNFEGRFKYIIVDEYQDVNECQQEMVRMLAGDTAQVMVVGDADQCIYEWRGAKPKYITTLFEEDFKGASNYQLSYTFRYGHAISLAANYLIRHNMDRNPQTCLSFHTTPFTKVETHAVKDFDNTVSNILKDWKSRGKKLSDAAILVRLYSMSASLEIDLLKNKIPYAIQGRTSVLDRDEFQGMLNFVRLSRNSLDGKTVDETSERIRSMLYFTNINLRASATEVCDHIAIDPMSGGAYLRELSKSTSGYLKQNLLDRSEIWDACRNKYRNAPASEVMEYVVKKLQAYNYFEKLHLRSVQSEEKIRLIKSFIDIAREVEDGGESFIQFVEDCLKEQATSSKKRKIDAVTILSIHKAKGMEWPLVIMPGLKEGDFPFYTESSPPVEVESERRLFYVGMTRAEEELHLLHPHDAKYEEISDKFDTNCEAITHESASRFLYESNIKLAKKVASQLWNDEKRQIHAVNGSMAQEYLEKISSDLTVSSEKKASDKIYTRPKGFSVGDRVYHPIFGEGDILEMEGGEKNTVEIKFDKEKDAICFLMKTVDLRRIEKNV